MQDAFVGQEAFVGVDVGTLSARAGIFDARGELLASARRPIRIWREAGEIVEQSSENVWEAVCAAIREAVAASGLPTGALKGLGFDATCSLVALDRAGEPLSVSRLGDPQRNIIVWMDHRASEEAREINAGRHPVLRYVGGKLSPEMEDPKAALAKRRRPDAYASAGHFFDLTDFLTYRASGSLSRSTCTVTCKFTYLAHEERWEQGFFDAVGLSELGADGFARIGSEVVHPGAPLGAGLTPEAARATGLNEGLPVGAGLIDAHAGSAGTLGAALGGAPADPRRRVALILGTSACCMAISNDARFIEGVWGPYFSAIIPGQWVAEGGQSAFGAAIDHLLRLHPAFPQVFKECGDLALQTIEDEVVARAGGLSQAALLARDLHVLPEFLGNRSPFADPRARGAIVGLDLREDRESLGELYVAGVVGLALGLRQVIHAMENAGHDFEMIVVSGGAGKSPLVRQIIADAIGKPVGAPRTPEPVLLGAAMLGAVAAGRYTMLEAMASMSALGSVIRPAGGGIADFHTRKFAAYERLQALERELRTTMEPAAPTSAQEAHWPALVIFDCDGVLVDSEVIALDVTRRALCDAGLEWTTDQVRERFLGLRVDTIIREAQAELGGSLPIDFREKLARDIEAAFVGRLRGVKGVAEAVHSVSALRCVASSSPIERVRAALRMVGTADLFEPHIFSAGLVERGKPSPDLFLFAAKSMGVDPSQCLVIEDSLVGVQAAKASGMSAFGFVGGSHFVRAAQATALLAAGADLVFADMRALPGHIDEFGSGQRLA